MQLNEFEKHIASNIDDYQSKIDTDSLWDTLETDLHQEKKKKRRFIFLVFGLLLVSGLAYMGMSSYLSTSNSDSKLSSSIIEQSTSVNNHNADELNFNREEAIHLETDSPTSTTESAISLVTTNNQTKTTTSNIKSKATNKDVRSSQIGQVSRNQQALISNFANDKVVSGSLPNVQNIFNNRQQRSQSELKPNLSLIDTQRKDVERLDYLDIIPLDIIEFEKMKYKLKMRPSIKPIKMPNKLWRMSIIPQFGIYYTDRTIVTNNSMGEDLIDYRSDSEQILETMSLGIGVEWQHKSNLFVSGKVNINQLTEKFTGQTSEIKIESINYIEERNFLGNGMVEEVPGTFDQRQETITTSTVYNTLRWVELTLGGGYHIDMGRWQVGAGAGLMWGTMLNAEGRIFNANRNIIDIENQSSSIYRNNLGLGGYGLIDLRYALDKRLSITTQLGYKFYANSFTHPSYPLDITYRWWGGTVGVSYHMF